MNILYHHRTQGTGAEGVHISQIIAGLRTLKHHVHVVSPNDHDPSLTAGNNPYAQKQGSKARLLNSLSRLLPQCLFELLEMAYNLFAASKLTKVLRENPIDFIYERQAFFLSVGARLAKKHRLPYIVEVNEIAGEHRVRRQFFVGLAKRIERYVFNQANAIIVVSPFLKKQIAAMGIEANKIHVIPNGVDTALFNPTQTASTVRTQLNFDDHHVVIGFIGWFVPWHNLDLLIKVTAQLSQNYPVRLMLVGDGALKEHFLTLAASRGIKDRLILPGAITYAKIPAYIQAMDIAIIPGSNQYRSPIKLFEYMAMEKPVVAPHYEPIEMIIEHNQDGMLFQPDDEKSLYENLRALLENPAHRTTLGKNARKKVMREHRWVHNSQRVLNIYAEINDTYHPRT